jgi:trans-aconitate 2-methyltransferase
MVTNDWNSTLYDQKHAFIFQYGKDVLAMLNPQAGETIIDLGCGTGHLTKAIADAGAQAVGLDSSDSMVTQAQALYPDVPFRLADARDFTVEEPVDAVFSNATLHWIPQAEEVIACISKALKPGGRFVAEFGGKDNCVELISELQKALQDLTGRYVEHGWFFASIGEYTPLLEKRGLLVRRAEWFERLTKLEDGEQGIATWFEMFCGRMLHGVPEDVKAEAIKRVEQGLRDQFWHDGSWYALYRRLRVVAYKPE